MTSEMLTCPQVPLSVKIIDVHLHLPQILVLKLLDL